MDTISVFTYGALILFLLQLTKHFVIPIITNTRNNNLPPSPPSLPIIGHLHHLRKPLRHVLTRLAAQHGPILLLRFGTRSVLVISSSALAEECLITNDITFASRPKLPSIKIISNNFASIGTDDMGPRWRENRRVATVEALSGHRLAFFADVRAEEARYLARRLFRETADGGFSKVGLKSRLDGLTMNGLMRVMMGKSYYGEEERDEEGRRFKSKVEEVSTVLGASNVGDFLPTVIGWFLRRGVERKLRRILAYRDEFWQGIVDDRRKEREAEGEEGRKFNKTMLDAILNMQMDKPEQYTDSFIKTLFNVIS